MEFLSNVGNNIFVGFLNFVIFVANLILTPIINFLNNLIPDLSTSIDNASTLVNNAIQHIPTLLDICCVPRGAMILFFDFIVVLLAYYTGIRFYSFVKNIIHLFK